MKILHITKKYPNAIGGDATYVANLEGQQRISGNQVFILTADCKEIGVGEYLYKFGLKDLARNWDRITLRRIISSLFFFFYLPLLLNESLKHSF